MLDGSLRGMKLYYRRYISLSRSWFVGRSHDERQTSTTLKQRPLNKRLKFIAASKLCQAFQPNKSHTQHQTQKQAIRHFILSENFLQFRFSVSTSKLKQNTSRLQIHVGTASSLGINYRPPSRATRQSFQYNTAILPAFTQ